MRHYSRRRTVLADSCNQFNSRRDFRPDYRSILGEEKNRTPHRLPRRQLHRRPLRDFLAGPDTEGEKQFCCRDRFRAQKLSEARMTWNVSAIMRGQTFSVSRGRTLHATVTIQKVETASAKEAPC